jgi:hypothetical protein
MQKKFFVAVILAVLVALPLVFVSAADYLPKNKDDGGSVVISGQDAFHNLYVGGGTVVVNKEITGDLFTGGGSINVAAPIGQDLFAVGGVVTVTKPVEDDARIAGGHVTINAPVSGDLLMAGGTISISEEATVGGDIWAAGGMISLNSDVAGNAKLAGGEIFINSKIEGTLEVNSEDKLTFGPQSVVLGSIVHYSPHEAIIQDGARVSEIDFKRTEKTKKGLPFAGLSIILLIKILAVFIAGLVALKLFGRTSRELVSSTYAKFWSNLGIGLVGTIVTPILAILLMITFVGVYVGVVLLLGFILTVLVAGLYGVMLIGATIEKWIRKTETAQVSWLTVLWGVLVGGILLLIPFVGCLIITVFYLASFGAVLRALKQRLEM